MFAARPWYRDRNSTPSPSPNGISTPMIELRSRARTPSNRLTSAASNDPTSDPATTFTPSNNATGGAGERQLADPVHGERQVAHHHDHTDGAGHQAECRTGDQRRTHQGHERAVVGGVEVEVGDLPQDVAHA